MKQSDNKEEILVINPGTTSTKFAVYSGEELVFKQIEEHAAAETEKFERLIDQCQYRLDFILAALQERGIALSVFKAVVGRGGLLKPLKGGTYRVNQLMLQDLRKAEWGEHVANLGAIMAYALAQHLQIPAFVVDPVSVDELEPVARISGLPDLERVSLSHALNMKAVARKAAGVIGRSYQEVNFIVAHLGTGISVSAHQHGRMIDVNNAMDEGPLSPDRCGGLPAKQLVKLCYSGKYTCDELEDKLAGQGGIYAYIGTKNIREVEKLAGQGEKQAELVLAALVYQVAKEIGSMAAVLTGAVDQIILTGGIAYSSRIVSDIKARVQFIAPIMVIPGEEELEALALGALRVLRNEERAQVYC
ncbi:MAG: butyrate kinase [Veillonellales bacterium]